jgi:hypothetical protein
MLRTGRWIIEEIGRGAILLLAKTGVSHGALSGVHFVHTLPLSLVGESSPFFATFRLRVRSVFYV